MELNTAIDRQSYVPLYVQVKDSLRDLILGGRAPGEQLPGEPELCRRHDVRRTVIRQALRDLELEGLSLREKGRGPFGARAELGAGVVPGGEGAEAGMAAHGAQPVVELAHTVEREHQLDALLGQPVGVGRAQGDTVAEDDGAQVEAGLAGQLLRIVVQLLDEGKVERRFTTGILELDLGKAALGRGAHAVSYTHLTLPTRDLV